MLLKDQIKNVVVTAQVLRTKGETGEANTKAALIEPILQSLGWDTQDPSTVLREKKAFAGKFVDYVLLVDGDETLIIEAKPLDTNLSDEKIISQALNYANTLGVRWAILTNGLQYRIYDNAAPGKPRDKLFREVDLVDDDNKENEDAAEALQKLDQRSLSDGSLGREGDATFADRRVRQALRQIAANPLPELLERIESVAGQPTLDKNEIKASLLSIWGVAERSAGSENPSQKGKPSWEDHIADKPAAISELAQKFDSLARSVGADIERRPSKFYVGYFGHNKSFCTIVIQTSKIRVFLGLEPGQLDAWAKKRTKDVSNVGHYGMGNTEFVLTEASQAADLEKLLAKAYSELGSTKKP